MGSKRKHCWARIRREDETGRQRPWLCEESRQRWIRRGREVGDVDKSIAESQEKKSPWYLRWRQQMAWETRHNRLLSLGRRNHRWIRPCPFLASCAAWSSVPRDIFFNEEQTIHNRNNRPFNRLHCAETNRVLILQSVIRSAYELCPAKNLWRTFQTIHP